MNPAIRDSQTSLDSSSPLTPNAGYNSNSKLQYNYSHESLPLADTNPSASTASSTPNINVLAHEDELATIPNINANMEPTGTKISSIINIVNTILGAGMLSLPYTIAAWGMLPGQALIILSAAASIFGLYILTESARFTKGRNASFYALCLLTYPKTAILFDSAIAIKCFGVSITYLILVKQLMKQVMLSLNYDPTAWYSKEQFWLTLFMLFIVPLAFLRKLDSMKYTSLLALTAVVYLVIILCYAYLHPFANATPAGQWVVGKLTLNGFASLPVFIFAFTCHQNIFSVYNELRDNSRKQVATTVFAAVTLCAGVYEYVGTIGYVMFGSRAADQILKNLGIGTPLAVCRIMLTVLFVFSYSLQSHPARDSLTRVLSAVTGPQYVERNNRMIYYTITTILLLCSFFIAFFVDDVERVLAYVGSSASTSICYVLPGLFYYKLHQDQPWTRMKIGAFALFIMGCFLVPFCLLFQVLKAFGVIKRGLD